MARFTPILGTLSGKVSGVVFSRNKGGSYLKKWVKPTNPRTVAQGAARGAFSVSSATWNALTLAQKSAWNAYAVSSFKAKTGRVGVIYSGFQAFVSLGQGARSAKSASRVLTCSSPAAATLVKTTVSPGLNAPAGIFTGQIQVTAGVPSSLTIASATLTVAGVFSVVMNSSVLFAVTAPLFTDLGSGRKVGLIFYGGLGDSPSSKNLQTLGCIPAPTAAGTWAVQNTLSFSFAGSDLPITDRKLWYTIGSKVQISAYAVSEIGEFKLLGQTALTVTA